MAKIAVISNLRAIRSATAYKLRRKPSDTSADEQIAIEEIRLAFDSAREAAQDAIAAADRNLRLMEDCTRELKTMANIARWSNEYSVLRPAQALVSSGVSTVEHAACSAPEN